MPLIISAISRSPKKNEIMKKLFDYDNEDSNKSDGEQSDMYSIDSASPGMLYFIMYHRI